MKFGIGLLLALALALLGLAVLRVVDRRADRAEWNRLKALQPDDPALFSEDMVAGLRQA